MVVENELVVKESYRNKLWAAGLSHQQIDAIVEVVFEEADNTVDRIGVKAEGLLEEMQPRVVEALGKELRPAIVEMIESEVALRIGRLEQRMEQIRKSMPIPKSNLFGEEPQAKPRRRLRRYVAVGIGAMILGPIVLSLLAAGMKALLESLLTLLS